jgi:hypothetical protein
MPASSPMPFARALALTALATLALGGCAAISLDDVLPERARGVPGFDTRDYPGDAAMRTWLEHSPYRWVGYYLTSPCFRGRDWLGTRPRLESMGWGMAVLFVGEQDWAEILPADQVIADPTLPRCTRANLRADRGAEHAVEAATTARAEGFPDGSVVYLNVERVERVSDDLRDYVRMWTRGLLTDGRYVPGLYAHARNAEELRAIQREEFARAGRGGEPRLWVALIRDFDLRRAPQESGFPAHIWQGVLDTRETWGGVTLHIDANVARSAYPSR